MLVAECVLIDTGSGFTPRTAKLMKKEERRRQGKEGDGDRGGFVDAKGRQYKQTNSDNDSHVHPASGYPLVPWLLRDETPPRIGRMSDQVPWYLGVVSWA